MRNITFKDYLMLDEDTASDIAQLSLQRQQLVMKKALADRTIDQQVANLDKQIFQKEKMKQAEDKKNGVDQQQNQDPRAAQNNQMRPQGNQTVQPGSTGSQTPGSAPPAQRQG